jgi:uncharacterized protein
VDTLVILGASVRAAAFSARRAGFALYCGDLFADLDLRRCARATVARDYPRGLATIANAAPTGPWMYTGGLEDYPDLVDEIATRRPLYGNPGSVLREVRDPFRLADALRSAGLEVPAVAASPDRLPCDGSWLRKPCCGSGGTGIAPWLGERTAPGSKRARSDHYFQQRIEGIPHAAVYLIAGGEARLLGVTRQWIGIEWAGADGFRYAGSIGPVALDAQREGQFEQIGAALARQFALTGLVGVDAVIAGEVIWPVEVNPRYPASAEVLERGLGISAVGMHIEACRHSIAFRSAKERNFRGAKGDVAAQPGPLHAKAILYARADLTVSPAFAEWAEAEMNAVPWPRLADVPPAGTLIRAGWPITTVLDDGPDEAAVEEALRQRIAELERLLFVEKPHGTAFAPFGPGGYPSTNRRGGVR